MANLFTVLLLYMTLACLKVRGKEVRIHGKGGSEARDVYLSWISGYKATRRPFVHLDMTYDSRPGYEGSLELEGELGDSVQYISLDTLLDQQSVYNTTDVQIFPILARY